MKAERRRQITVPRPAVDKRTVWAEIRRRDPEFASDLAVLCKAFGKPAGLRVEIDGDVLIDTLPSHPVAQGRDARRPSRASASAVRPAPNTMPALDDLKSASPEQLARMKATLKRKAKTRR